MGPEKPEKKYRRTEKIVLGVAMTALIVSGCSDEQVDQRRCVDRTGTVTQSYNCDDDETTRRYGSSGMGVYNWYFGGDGYTVGETVRGGSRTPPRGYTAPTARMGKSGSSLSGARYASASGVSRGGIGSSASAHGSGGS